MIHLIPYTFTLYVNKESNTIYSTYQANIPKEPPVIWSYFIVNGTVQLNTAELNRIWCLHSA